MIDDETEFKEHNRMPSMDQYEKDGSGFSSRHLSLEFGGFRKRDEEYQEIVRKMIIETKS